MLDIAQESKLQWLQLLSDSGAYNNNEYINMVVNITAHCENLIDLLL